MADRAQSRAGAGWPWQRKMAAMQIAILADIHANREALDAVLARLEALRPARTILLGDIVGYGPDPGYTADMAMRLAADGAICLQGNHDEAAAGRGAQKMTENARDAMRWTQGRLSDAQKAFLAALPASHREGDVLFTHASAARPGSWPYILDADGARDCLAATDAWSVIVGHTHVPALYYAANDGTVTPFRPLANRAAPLFAGRRQVVVAGSVGQPRCGNPTACMALLDTAERSVTMVRVPYDSATTAAKIEAAGLPGWLGTRLQIGR